MRSVFFGLGDVFKGRGYPGTSVVVYGMCLNDELLVRQVCLQIIW